MAFEKTPGNRLCPCGSGKAFHRCCRRGNLSVALLEKPLAVHGEGAEVVPSARTSQDRVPAAAALSVVRVGVDYTFDDAFSRAQVSYAFPIGLLILLADGGVCRVENLRAGMRFKLEDGLTATVTDVESPKKWSAPSRTPDDQGRFERRVLGRIQRTSYAVIDVVVAGQKITTSPGHPFWSVTRRAWVPAETLQRGELLRLDSGGLIAVEAVTAPRFGLVRLDNLEVEDLHTFFVATPKRGVLVHNGLGPLGCNIPKPAIVEALEKGVINATSKFRAGVINLVRHHIFPQEFRAWFAARGINVDQFIIIINRTFHEALHAGGGPGRGGGWWSTEMMRQLNLAEAAAGRMLNPGEILSIGAQVLRRFGL